jgi:hypothetical protein
MQKRVRFQAGPKRASIGEGREMGDEGGTIMRYSLISLVLALSVGSASLSWAQSQKGVGAPAEQRELTNILSKYNNLYESAPNGIQKEKILPAFKKDFCSKIPKGQVSAWVGEVSSIDVDPAGEGIRLILSVNTDNIFSGGLGVELSLGNRYAYGVTDDNTQPHPSTIIPPNSPLFEATSNLRSGDAVIFSGSFVPYTSEQACYDNDTTYFSLFNFTSIKTIGYDVTIH